MVSISNRVVEIEQTAMPVAKNKSRNLLEIYQDFTASQSNQGILWFMKVIIAIPCVFMVISIIVMSMITSNYIWFVGLNMVLFFANVVAHISEMKSTFYVPLYHATIVLLTIIPIITYLIIS